MSLQGLIRRLKNDCSPKDSLARVLRVLSGAHQAALIAFPTGATTEAQKSQIQLCPGLWSFLRQLEEEITSVSYFKGAKDCWVQSLGQEDTREKGMANHSSILAWRIPWIEEPGRLSLVGVHGLTKSQT